MSTTDCILSQKIESMNELCVSSNKKEFMKLCKEIKLCCIKTTHTFAAWEINCINYDTIYQNSVSKIFMNKSIKAN